MTTLLEACDAFIANIAKSYPGTATSSNYHSTLLGADGLIPSLKVKPSSPIEALTEKAIIKYFQALRDRGTTQATRQRAASAVRGFIRYLAYNYQLNTLSVDRLDSGFYALHLLKGTRSHRTYPGEKVQRMLDFAMKLTPQPADLIMLRDLAFVFTLAQTGLRVHEAVALRVGDVDRNFRATIIGKGGKKATVKWGKDARARLNAYLRGRASLDASTGRPRSSLPLFARHDLTSGKTMVKAINTHTAEKIVHNMAALALGREYDPAITCHILRHYFGSTVYHKTKDPKRTQIAMRHKNIETTFNVYVHANDEDAARTVTDVFG